MRLLRVETRGYNPLVYGTLLHYRIFQSTFLCKMITTKLTLVIPYNHSTHRQTMRKIKSKLSQVNGLNNFLFFGAHDNPIRIR